MWHEVFLALDGESPTPLTTDLLGKGKGLQYLSQLSAGWLKYNLKAPLERNPTPAAPHSSWFPPVFGGARQAGLRGSRQPCMPEGYQQIYLNLELEATKNTVSSA